MLITLSGKPGSGKSTLAKLLADNLNYKVFSAGDLRGQIAMKHNLTIDQLNEIGKRERWTDEECDKLLEKMGKTQNNIIFDSWLAWHFIPSALKIFLDVDMNEAAKRIFANQRPDEPHQTTVQGVKDMLENRLNNSRARFKKWYNVDILDMSNYDLIIDTTCKTVDDSLKEVLKFAKKKSLKSN